jgi:hypothetical protein
MICPVERYAQPLSQMQNVWSEVRIRNRDGKERGGSREAYRQPTYMPEWAHTHIQQERLLFLRRNLPRLCAFKELTSFVFNQRLFCSKDVRNKKDGCLEGFSEQQLLRGTMHLSGCKGAYKTPLTEQPKGVEHQNVRDAR